MPFVMVRYGKIKLDKGDKTVNEQKTELVPAREGPAGYSALPEQSIEKLAEYLAEIRSLLENNGVSLRAGDRRRLNGVGVATEGFITRAFGYAVKNPQLLPYFVPFAKFREDYKNFVSFYSLLKTCNSVRDMLWNNALYAADTAYGDALELYAGARRSAFSKLKAFESVYRDLFPFFKKTRKAKTGPTQDEVLSDVKALLRGKRDGRVVIENVRPKVTGGEHKVIDKKYEDGGRYEEEFTTNHTNGHEQKL
jgi:hypothetical protein